MKAACLLLLMLTAHAQTKFHKHYLSADASSGITIHLQAVEDAGCVHTDTCGWEIRWDSGQKVKAKWDTAVFDVGYLDGPERRLLRDSRTILSSDKSQLYPAFVEPLGNVVYIRVTLAAKGKVLARAEFQ